MTDSCLHIQRVAGSQPARTKVREFLEQYRGRRIYHPPLATPAGQLVGNNGDRLMVLGTERVYQELDIEKVDEGSQADLLVIGASGGLLERAQHIPRIFRDCCRQWPDKPLCVLPSTYYYPQKPFAEEIGERSGLVMLFCREARSYDHLTKDHVMPSNVDLAVDPDLAFELTDTLFVDQLKYRPQKHILLVERTDVEKNPQVFAQKKTGIISKLRKHCPPGLKSLLYPLVRKARSMHRGSLRLECERIINTDHSEAAQLPWVVGDASNINVCNFEQFCDAVAGSKIVFTTRLHVGILASMLGRRTYIFEGPYHKIRGIYELSLSQMDHVTLLPALSEEHGA